MNPIIIEVHGGVAEMVQKPKGVVLIIRDYDNEPMTEEEWTADKEFAERADHSGTG